MSGNHDLSKQIAAKKAELDRLCARLPHALDNLNHAFDIELTYTSNAIEGNTLTVGETALVVEQGITIGGKPLKDHLEAIDHHAALRYVRSIASERTPLTEMDVRNLHRLVMLRSDPDIAGRYADQARMTNTDQGRHYFPVPAEVPALMGDFAKWLASAPDTPETAFTAHRRLVEIHPFNDGNGRTARLLMNLVLLRGGYPPVAVRPEDRPAYIRALQEVETLQEGEAGHGIAAFERLLYERLDMAMGESLNALSQALAASPTQAKPGDRPKPA